MRIEELHLKNFRCFKELDIKFPESNLAVFIGLNGSGKTAILDAIALVLNNYLKKHKSLKGSDFIYKNDDVSITESDCENKIFFNSGSEKQWSVIFNKNIVLNGINLDIIKFRTDEYEEGEDFFCSFFKTEKDGKNLIILGENSCLTNFDELEKWIEQEENMENEIKREQEDFNYTTPRLDVVRKATMVFLSSISGADFSNLRVKRKRIDNDIKSELYITYDNNDLKLEQLSSGQKLLIYLVGSIAHQLSLHIGIHDVCDIDFDEKTGKEDHRYYKWSDNNILEILAYTGAVLIDEIELHLHPQWQREVLPALQKTFPNIQFIVTTHSPQVLSNVKKEEIFILENGALVKNTPHTQGRDSNSILYELFGVEERPREYRHKINAFYDALEDEKFDDAKTILSELTELFGEEDSEIVRAKLHLNFALSS
jgi:predicted ATP-binding protein involved in virulence